MSEPTDADDEEALPEDEYELESSNSDASKTYLQIQAISAGRQFFCSCSSMSFPVIACLYDNIGSEIPTYLVINFENNTRDNVLSDHANKSMYNDYVLVISIIAYIISGVSLLLIGRKYSVIIAHLSNLAILIYSYSYVEGEGFGPKLSYKFSLVTVFVREFATVPFFMYVAEITSPNFRAFFLAFFYLNGALFKIEVDDAKYETTGIHQLFLSCAVLSGLSLLITLYMPETPFWQALKGDAEKAEETFSWLRADEPDTFEFNQMIASAENLVENRGIQIVKHLTSSTFVLGVMFSCSIALCTFDRCRIMYTFLNEYYFPYDQVIGSQEYKDVIELIQDSFYRLSELYHPIIALTIFLCSCFVIPRKILFFISHALGIIIVTVVPLPVKLGFKTLRIKVAAYCNFSQYLGVLPLSMILPVEIYPVALREVGVVITAIANKVVLVLLKTTEIRSRPDFPVTWVAPTTSIVYYFGSLIGTLFNMLFMPETKGTTLYELDEITFSLPFSRRRKSFMAEDEEGSMIGEAEEE